MLLNPNLSSSDSAVRSPVFPAVVDRAPVVTCAIELGENDPLVWQKLARKSACIVAAFVEIAAQGEGGEGGAGLLGRIVPVTYAMLEVEARVGGGRIDDVRAYVCVFLWWQHDVRAIQHGPVTWINAHRVYFPTTTC